MNKDKSLLLGLFLLSFILIIGPVSALTLNDNLLGYYTLNSSSVDSLGLHNGTDTSITYNSGKVGFGANFSGSSKIHMGDNFDIGTDNFSLSLWFNIPSSANFHQLIGKSNASSYPSWELRKTNSNVISFGIFGVGGSYSLESPTSITDTGWKHLVITRDVSNGSEVTKMYINNSLVNTKVYATVLNPNNSLFFKMGETNSTGSPFNLVGQLDELMLTGRVLDESEISILYNNFNGVSYPFPVTTTLNSPVNATTYLVSDSVTFNWTASSQGTLVNTTLFINDQTNYTTNISGLTETVTTTTYFSSGSYNWLVMSCDTDSCTNSTRRYFNVTSIIDGGVTYNSTTTEGLVNTFTTQQTVATGYTITGATFEYNNTNYTTSISFSSGVYTISSTVSAPIVTADSNISLRFYITTGGVAVARTSYNQTVENLDFSVCGGASNDLLLNMSLYDEVTKLSMTGEIQVTADIIEKSSGNTIETLSTNFTSVKFGALCFSPVSSYDSYSLDLEARYSATDYVSELYHIQNADLVENDTLGLYILNSSSSTTFSIIYQDDNYVFVNGAIIQLQRKYLSTGTFEVVEAPITSSDGTTVLHIDLNGVKYKITVVKDGVLLDTFDNLVFKCQSELTGECEKKLFGSVDPQNSIEIDTLRDFVYTINRTANIIDVTFSIPSTAPSEVMISLVQYDQFGSYNMCNQTIVSSAGSLQCSFNYTIGDSYITLTIYKDGLLMALESYIVPEVNGVDFLGNNYIIIVVLLFSVVGMALTSPEWMVVNGIIVMLISGGLWLANGLSFVLGLGNLLWLIIVAGILIFKFAKQEDR